MSTQDTGARRRSRLAAALAALALTAAALVLAIQANSISSTRIGPQVPRVPAQTALGTTALRASSHRRCLPEAHLRVRAPPSGKRPQRRGLPATEVREPAGRKHHRAAPIASRAGLDGRSPTGAPADLVRPSPKPRTRPAARRPSRAHASAQRQALTPCPAGCPWAKTPRRGPRPVRPAPASPNDHNAFPGRNLRQASGTQAAGRSTTARACHDRQDQIVQEGTQS
jgi:hypothetical protein